MRKLITRQRTGELTLAPYRTLGVKRAGSAKPRFRPVWVTCGDFLSDFNDSAYPFVAERIVATARNGGSGQ